MKKVKEHLKLMPLQIRLQFMEETRLQRKNYFQRVMNTEFHSINEALFSCFAFGNSVKGSKYWLKRRHSRKCC